MSYIVRRDDCGEWEELVRESDETVIARLSADCPEDNNFMRSLSRVVDELNRLGEIEFMYEGLCK